MDKKWQYYTPDGVADLLPQSTAEKLRMEGRLRKLFSSHAYEEVQSSGLEFLDVYAAGSLVPAESLFKLIDEQGRILALRYDGTVPALRMAATKFTDSAFPLRLSYIQDMYRFNESGGGKQRSFTQAGVELIGEGTCLADAEVIALAIEATLALGIKDIQVSCGQVAFTKALFDSWGLDQSAERSLSELIDAKNILGVEAKAKELALEDTARRILQDLFDQPLSDEEWLGMQGMHFPEAAAVELNKLQTVLTTLREWGYSDYISVDLGMLSSMNYYTGLTFKGFTHDLAFPLFSGGRYDHAAAAFGKNLQASGFSIGVDLAQMVLRRRQTDPESNGSLLLIAAAEANNKCLWPAARANLHRFARVKLCYHLDSYSELLALGKQEGAEAVLWLDQDANEQLYVFAHHKDEGGRSL